jgi:hypothetical protein
MPTDINWNARRHSHVMGPEYQAGRVAHRAARHSRLTELGHHDLAADERPRHPERHLYIPP